MKERGILFSAPMVRAILAGTKTQTRRAVKPSTGYQSTWLTPEFLGASPRGRMVEADGGGSPLHGWAFEHPKGGPGGFVRCPYGAPGERLWVRETFYCDHFEYDPHTSVEKRADFLSMMEYRADHDCREWEAGCPCHDENGRSSWRPSIFMPRWASRITLDVVSVRVERLHDISEEDARAEGCKDTRTPVVVNDRLRPNEMVLINGGAVASVGAGAFTIGSSARDAFADLWRSINGAESWDANPWVWRIEFSRDREALARAGGRT